MSTREQLAVAALQGVATRWVVGNGDQWATASTVRLQLESGADPRIRPLADAVAELHTVTENPMWLSRAAARFTADDDTSPNNRYMLALLVAAGAGEAEAKAWRAAHPPQAFRPPQADPALHRRQLQHDPGS